MTDLIPVASLDPVTQIETTTLVLGGTGNPANQQAQALLNRDAFRAQQIASNTAAIGTNTVDIGNLMPRVDQAEIDISTIDSYNLSREYYRTVEEFGLVDTPANTLVTMQAAIDWCAANKVLLRAKASEYTVDFSSTSLTIPDNFRCDMGSAWIKRETGNTTPQDMWVNADTVAGNTGLDIRNVRFDGQRQADSLTNATPSHRFSGLRLVKCSGYVENVRADNTVNGEIQVEGTRGGVVLDLSADMRCFKLYADGTDGTGVFVYEGKNWVLGCWAKDNTGSGFSSFGCDDNDFHHIYSDGSGYSGVSVNGERMRCSFLSSKNSPLNYAGVNIGHDSAGNRADDSIIDNVTVESAAGWGINVTGSTNVTGSNWQAVGSAVLNLRVTVSPGLRVSYRGRDSLGSDATISTNGTTWIDCDISGAAFNGLSATSAGNRIEMGASSQVTACGTAGGTTGAINAANSTTIVVRGRIVDNLRYGAISAGGAAALVDLRGATVQNNTAGNFFSGSGGVLRYEKVRTSADAMTGTAAPAAAATTIVVSNGNAISASGVRVSAGNAAAVSNQSYVSAVTTGVNFTITLAAGAAGTESYNWEII